MAQDYNPMLQDVKSGKFYNLRNLLFFRAFLEFWPGAGQVLIH